MCVKGTRWVRENILERYPNEELEVYAIWFNMIPGDKKTRWNAEALPDKRVRHYWDTERMVGKWITKNVEDCQHLRPIDWDSYYLFDGDAVWGDNLEGIEAFGTPIINNTEPLKRQSPHSSARKIDAVMNAEHICRHLL